MSPTVLEQLEGYADPGVRLEGLEPELARRVLVLLVGTGEAVGITSAVRTLLEQKALYDNPPPGTTIVAYPGTSLHERGAAIDLTRRLGAPTWEHVHERAALVGLVFPIAGEPWHVQLIPNPPPLTPLQEIALMDENAFVQALAAAMTLALRAVFAEDHARRLETPDYDNGGATIATTADGLEGWAHAERSLTRRALERIATALEAK